MHVKCDVTSTDVMFFNETRRREKRNVLSPISTSFQTSETARNPHSRPFLHFILYATSSFGRGRGRGCRRGCRSRAPLAAVARAAAVASSTARAAAVASTTGRELRRAGSRDRESRPSRAPPCMAPLAAVASPAGTRASQSRESRESVQADRPRASGRRNQRAVLSVRPSYARPVLLVFAARRCSRRAFPRPRRVRCRPSATRVACSSRFPIARCPRASSPRARSPSAPPAASSAGRDGGKRWRLLPLEPASAPAVTHRPGRIEAGSIRSLQ